MPRQRPQFYDDTRDQIKLIIATEAQSATDTFVDRLMKALLRYRFGDFRASALEQNRSAPAHSRIFSDALQDALISLKLPRQSIELLLEAYKQASVDRRTELKRQRDAERMRLQRNATIH